MKIVSLLRGINVSGQKIIRMADLRALYEGLGLGQVATYIQSGNVVFESSETDRDFLQKKIQDGISDAYGFTVPVELRSHQELMDVVADCPFGEVDPAVDGAKVAVVFLSAEPSAAQVATLGKYVNPPDELVHRGREIYLRCPGGFGKTKLTNTLLEKKLGVAATSRNWRSVRKLCEMSG
jgi:uncharacterized protein (DUF1697 family)